MKLESFSEMVTKCPMYTLIGLHMVCNTLLLYCLNINVYQQLSMVKYHRTDEHSNLNLYYLQF